MKNQCRDGTLPKLRVYYRELEFYPLRCPTYNSRVGHSSWNQFFNLWVDLDETCTDHSAAFVHPVAKEHQWEHWWTRNNFIQSQNKLPALASCVAYADTLLGLAMNAGIDSQATPACSAPDRDMPYADTITVGARQMLPNTLVVTWQQSVNSPVSPTWRSRAMCTSAMPQIRLLQGQRNSLQKYEQLLLNIF